MTTFHVLLFTLAGISFPALTLARRSYEEVAFKLWGRHVLYPEANSLEKMRCATDTNQYGTCRTLSSCRRVLNGASNILPTVCGWNATIPYVCCPRRSLVMRNGGGSRRRDMATEPSASATPVISRRLDSGCILSPALTLEPELAVTTRRPRTTRIPSRARTTRPSISRRINTSPTLLPPIPAEDYQDLDQLPGDYDDSQPEETSGNRVVAPIPLIPVPGRLSYPGCGRREGVIDDNNVLARQVDERSTSWPWVVEISTFLFGVWKRFLCAGVLISPRYILTAAYCFGKEGMEVEPLMFSVRVGSAFVDQGRLYRVEKITIHEEYEEGKFYHDIAVVKLREEVDMADPATVGPVCLPSDSEGSSSQSVLEATLLGWGQKEPGGSKTDGELAAIALPVQPYNKCNSEYRHMETFFPRGISSDFVCAGNTVRGSDACTADLGSPLVIRGNSDRWVLVGVASGGFQCSAPGRPGVFTRITTYLDWIEKHTDLGALSS